MKYSLLLLITLLLFSCSVTKRKVLPGYHIDWNNSTSSISIDNNENKDEIKNNSKTIQASSTSNENLVLFQSLEDSIIEKCDTIVLLDGTKISAEIKKSTPKTIDYIKCGDETNFIIKLYKSNIHSIKYATKTDEKGNVLAEAKEVNIQSEKEEIEKKKNEIEKNESGKIIEPVGWLSFRFLAVSLALFLVVFISPLTGTLLSLLSTLGLLFLFISFILSCISTFKINKNPSLYKKTLYIKFTLFVSTFILTMLLSMLIFFTHKY